MTILTPKDEAIDDLVNAVNYLFNFSPDYSNVKPEEAEAWELLDDSTDRLQKILLKEGK